MDKNKAIPQGYMTVGEAAKKMDVTVRTLQHYDREGLLSPSAMSEGGRRLYTDKDMVKLHQILSLKHLGFSLDDIKNRLIPLDTPAEIAFEAHRALTLILQELRNRVNVGEKLIRPALKSPVVSNRHMALSALEGWTEQSGQALQELLPKMAGYLEGLLAEEVREDLRQRMEQILGKK